MIGRHGPSSMASCLKCERFCTIGLHCSVSLSLRLIRVHFQTPRSWSFVSDVMHRTPMELLHRVVAGCVGDGPAAEFVGFLQLYRELPDLDVILTQPETTPVPREPAILYALIGALGREVQTRNDAGSEPHAVSVAIAR